MKKRTISETLAGFIHETTYQDLPQDVRELAKLRILDALSCAVAGRNLPHSKIAYKVAKNSVGGSTLIGHQEKASLLDSVSANGVMIHSIVQDDILSGLVHPGSAVVSTAIGVGEDKAVSGQKFLTATVLGYELVGRIMRGTGRFTISSFRPSPTLTTFGAVAAAGKLMELDEEQLVNAIGYAASLTPGAPNEVWWSGTMEGMFQAGMSARAGLLSAILAQAGATASPCALEGKDGFFRCWGEGTEETGKTIEDLGQDFVISRMRVKAFPVCGANQRPIQIAETLAKHELRVSDITKIIERVGIGATKYAGLDFSGPFKTQFQAIMSMQFCTAAAVLGKPVASARFFAEHFDDPAVGELAKKVDLLEEEGRFLPRIEIHTVDGEICATGEEVPDRNIYIPTRENMVDKFRMLCCDFFGEKEIEEIIYFILEMDTMADVRKLTGRLGVRGS